MNESPLDAFIRALADNSLTRRHLARGLAGAMAAAGLVHALGNDLEAKRRKKGKKRKRRRQRNGGSRGGVETPGGGDFCGGACGSREVCVDGLCVEVIGSQGSGDGELDSPTSIALNAGGIAFVTDTGNDRLVVLGGGEFGDANFVNTAGVAVNLISGDIYVSDIGLDTITRMSADGTVLNTFGGLGNGDDQFRNPFGVAVDPLTGQLFVADTTNNRIQRMSAIGQPLGRFGGEEGRELSSPDSLVVNSNGEVIVADTANHRIQVFDRDGRFIRVFGSEGRGDGQFNSPVAVTVDAAGNIFVVDLDNRRIQQFTSDGQFVGAFGRFGSGPGEFDDPRGIAIDKDGRIFVVDQGNHRVQVFRRAAVGAGTAGLAAQSDTRRETGAVTAGGKARNKRTRRRPTKDVPRRSRR
jgi:DNA-binding beta-propeller fold protein YncE